MALDSTWKKAITFFFTLFKFIFWHKGTLSILSADQESSFSDLFVILMISKEDGSNKMLSEHIIELVNAQ